MPRLLVVITLIITVVLIACYPSQVEEGISVLIEWIKEQEGLGIFTLGLIIAAGTAIAMPGSFLTISTGYILNDVYDSEHWKIILIGAFTAFAGTFLGSILCFCTGRYIFRELTTRMAQKFKIIRALDCAFYYQGFRFCFLFRICPLVPFNAFNFLAGATSLSFGAYIFAFIGYLPACIFNVWIGTSIKSIKEITSGEYEGGTTGFIVLIISLILCLVIVIYISCLVRRYLKKIADKNEPMMQYESSSNRIEPES